MILCTIAVPAFSQQFEGGFFGGFSASQIDGDNNSGYNKFGITAGAYTTRKINNNINWKAEIRYIQKGSYIKSVMLKTTLHYVEIPILLQYFQNKKLFFEAGLVPEILLKSIVEDKGYVSPIDPKNLFNTFELEATAGVGYFLTDNLGASVRLNYSLFPAGGRTPGPTIIFHRGQYNNVLNFSLFYHFH